MIRPIDMIETLAELKFRIKTFGTIQDVYLDRTDSQNCQFCVVGHLMDMKGISHATIEESFNGNDVLNLPHNILSVLQKTGFTVEELAKLQHVNDATYGFSEKRNEKLIAMIDSKIEQIKSLSPTSPKVAITLEGGLVRNVFSDTPLDYTIIDYTVDSHDSDDGRYTILPTGDAALAWTAKAQVLPDEFVRLGIPLDYVEEV